MTKSNSAFISHSSPDDIYVQEFVQLVRALGYSEVFNDSHTIEPDEKFWERIERGIRECDAFVVILSQASVKSYWVDKEIQFARSEGKRVIPIRIDDCKLPSSFDGRDVIELKNAGKVQRLSPPRFIHHVAEHFLGREPQLTLLDEAWTNGTNVLSIIAWGGVGKTALLCEWIEDRFIKHHWHDEEGKPLLAAYFDWTFYDQGTRSLADGTEARTGSVGDFFEQSLVFFGDPDPNLPGKGRRLADLIRQQRSLIVLDGLDPLQHPPGHPQAGRLLDPDLRDLLAALAQSNPGLCLITSRYALTDIPSSRRTVHTEHELENLPVAIAIRLLREFQIKGADQELGTASEKFGCHALSLTLLGRYLFDAHCGDIRRIDQIHDLERADILTRPERHRSVWRILETYESWLATAQADENPKALAVLRLTGLFDRTATVDCLAALRAQPIIPGLTDAICGMANDEWNSLLKRLERAHLIKRRKNSNIELLGSQSSWGVDAHPLIREYFAKQLKKTQPEAFKAAHSRLFDHLSRVTEFQPATLERLQPLYQAVSHGCLAQRNQEACEEVYVDRILRGMGNDGFFSTKQLGAISCELKVVSEFFEVIWAHPSKSLIVSTRNWLLSHAGYYLKAMGRCSEAFDPMQKGFDIAISSDCLIPAAVSANNLSNLELLLGRMDDAISHARRAIELADQVGDSYLNGALRAAFRTTAAEALHQAGRHEEARCLFVEAERMQAERNTNLPILYSVQGFRFRELLMDRAGRVAWIVGTTQKLVERPSLSKSAFCDFVMATQYAEFIKDLRKDISWHTSNDSLLDIALDNLSIARSSLCIALFGHESFRASDLRVSILESLSEMRASNQISHIPLGLLTGAFYHGTLGENLEEAERLLEEAQQIAERGPMPLHLADVHLYRARLFGRLPEAERQAKFPDINPKGELAEARRIIEKHGYWRRKEELEDAETAAVHW